MVYRNATYRLYPNASQRELLCELLRHHHALYNAAVQERSEAWKRARVNVTKTMQCRQLTQLRSADPEFAAINAQSQQVTLERVDRAFDGFFRRVKLGQTPGYPRFKSQKRFRGWGYKSHGNGWRLTLGTKRRNGTLRLAGIGDALRIRGRVKFDGLPKTMDVIHERGKWLISVVFEASVKRVAGSQQIGVDWGVENFLTLSTGETIANPRFGKNEAGRLKQRERRLSRKKRGSRNYYKALRVVAKSRNRVTCRRRDFLHKTSAALVGRASLIATEMLQIRNITASARGAREKPGVRVRQKAGLNRSILDTAPAMFLSMVRYKAEEAGVEFVEVPTREVKPSQRCPGCGQIRKKDLRERRHRCECGTHLHRDHAAALVCLQWALKAGDRPCVEVNVGSPVKHETNPVAAQAAQDGVVHCS
jgi:putative transposase